MIILLSWCCQPFRKVVQCLKPKHNLWLLIPSTAPHSSLLCTLPTAAMIMWGTKMGTVPRVMWGTKFSSEGK